MARSSLNHEHGGLYCPGAEPVQGFLARLSRTRAMASAEAAIKRPREFMSTMRVCRPLGRTRAVSKCLLTPSQGIAPSSCWDSGHEHFAQSQVPPDVGP